MSPRARKAIESADVVVGYDTYLKLATEVIGNKETFGSGMMQEIERCQAAVDLALNGKNIAVISSGDPGIYGMAGLILELAMQHSSDIRPEVTVIPGISAVSAAAALLGAPLMHDFAVISLSNLLTPWEVIRKRVEMAAAADFVIALYNPKSVKRVTQIEEVREILLQHRPATTPVGIVHHATRPEEKQVIATLDNFTQEFIDMFSLVIIGNSQTVVREGRMITPRGYQL
ncbi:cobalt-precorrin-3B C(17)-methyltransferase [Anaerosporomusa subterranea]|uniref:Cobalt-precorrin-3B C(17)-methyltransferase n=1 Tax=Anaerosporomusa subterranea TaxID=1794912 RepID=A0A154BSM2_ANASB|nr:precorrin-3B C(17)-methyltransferase [Anaerosporomusa subterranea]KYZ76865.1 cobalt-precorrin-3B C(17)-methyltransferase [Anaerosporomusa subterranea]